MQTPIFAGIPIASPIFPTGMHFGAAQLTPRSGDPCFIGPEGKKSGRYVGATNGIHRVENADGLVHVTDRQGLYLDLREELGRCIAAAWLGPHGAVVLDTTYGNDVRASIAHVLYTRKCNGCLSEPVLEPARDDGSNRKRMEAGVILIADRQLLAVVGYM